MGPTACHKVRKIIQNISDTLAIELLTACQATDLRSPLKPNKTLCKVYDRVRELSPYMEKDRSLSGDIKKISEILLKGEILTIIEDTTKESFK